MKQLHLCLMIIIALLIGCSSKLVVKQTTAVPATAAPGDAVTFKVVFNGPKDAVQSVSATVREYPNMVLSLNDSGTDGDEQVGDNVWSYQTDIPWEAQAQLYHLDVQVIDKEGNEIISEGFESLAGTIELTIE